LQKKSNLNLLFDRAAKNKLLAGFRSAGVCPCSSTRAAEEVSVICNLELLSASLSYGISANSGPLTMTIFAGASLEVVVTRACDSGGADSRREYLLTILLLFYTISNSARRGIFF